jgi:hypothetical protein
MHHVPIKGGLGGFEGAHLLLQFGDLVQQVQALGLGISKFGLCIEDAFLNLDQPGLHLVVDHR